jgi:Ca2+-binding RTX toxin-like protein
VTYPSRVAVRALVPPVVLGLVVAAAGWLTVTPASASADATMCEGQMATIVATADYQTLTGTDGPDVISNAGFKGVNVLAGDGDDLVCAESGGFISDPEQGAVHGGPGDDTLVADAPRDPDYVPQLYGEAGNDVLRVKGGPALLSPGSGDDTIQAPVKPQLLHGLPTVSVIFGTATAGVRINVAAGTVRGEGHDTFTGVLGFEGTPGPDRFIGGPGRDFFTDVSAYDSVKPTSDFVQGRGGDDQFRVYHGFIEGGAGDDQLVAWHSTVRGGSGRDQIELGAGGSVHAGPGADAIYTLIDEEDPPALRTSSFSLDGDAGPDTIYLPSPQDEGGYWACLTLVMCRFHVDGGPGADVLSFQYVGGGVHLDLASGKGTYSKGAHAKVAHFEKVEGSSFADVLKGTRHADHLDGDEGPDRLFGRGGPDILHGGPGRDVAFGGPGHDQCAAEIRRSC